MLLSLKAWTRRKPSSDWPLCSLHIKTGDPLMAHAVEAWKERVEAHHAQSIRTQQAMGWSSAGQGGFFASLFSADPRRTDDPVLDLLISQIPAGASVLDVGGGAGRFALPLALR